MSRRFAKAPFISIKSISKYLSQGLEPIALPTEYASKTTRIVGIQDTAKIYFTKSRPKLVHFVSESGEIIKFLLKGHEDLSLDERLMSMFKSINILMEDLPIREHLACYSVIPFADNFGLIEWYAQNVFLTSLLIIRVPHHTQIYKLYQNWKSSQQISDEEFEFKDDLVYRKALDVSRKKKDGQITEEVQREAYDYMLSKAPSDLISKALWSGSFSPTARYVNLKRFRISLATTCIIGYIFGIGDRHLDNIMIAIQSGRIAHIDFNVAFEKGTRLRVPEIVPFRLTNNLVKALGTDAFGLFKLHALNVMRLLHKNAHVLESQLDVFLYDPISEWRSDIKIQEDANDTAMRDSQEQDEYASSDEEGMSDHHFQQHAQHGPLNQNGNFLITTLMTDVFRQPISCSFGDRGRSGKIEGFG